MFGRLLIILIVIAAAGGAFYHMRSTPQAGGGPVSKPVARATAADPYAEGEAHFIKSEYGLAISAFQKALANNPGDSRAARARFWIGKSYEDWGKPGEALKAYEEFVAAFPADEQTQRAKQRIEYLTGTGAK
jgi:TolA-binding protein